MRTRSDKPAVELWTDGSALGNPGPGGFGTILRAGPHERELSGGYRQTTNNRMELLAVVRGFEALKFPCAVTVHSDSQYVVNGIDKGWAVGWRSRGWRKGDKSPAENADLWARLLEVIDPHDVTMQWVRGHAGTPLNERADVLAREAAAAEFLGRDLPYELRATQRPHAFWTPLTVAQLASDIPTELPEELFTELARGRACRIERIVSRGHTTPEGTWYDQEADEWVMVVQGGATLEVEGQPPLELGPGDHITLPAHRRHRVTRTTTNPDTVWLAVHFET